MSTRRNNRLSSREIDIAIEPLEFNTLSFDAACKLFLGGAERRELR
ncbi:hypothetical protein H1Z61_05395 [Bacillus aquiflavi]|uniref:Uncharacterized protein n=1 Tax=Bacillus aquiflavi TaxID=2672567 RepID=A0A6B3VXD7_9BACI|nr:hypothetical protein [Bacillus aquiflavi]MBA4536589.1 hypothetical protein [Bacillus aquiflavi]NEY80957.1 hypothetical protein [Bacillus aquiflavi]